MYFDLGMRGGEIGESNELYAPSAVTLTKGTSMLIGCETGQPVVMDVIQTLLPDVEPETSSS